MILKYIETEWIRQANRYGRLAAKGDQEACLELIEKYAEATGNTPMNILIGFSVAYMDPRGFGYDEFKKIRVMIAWHRERLFSTT